MIETRGILFHPQELDERWLERAAALGLNVIGLHPVGGVKADETLRAMLDGRDEMAPLLAKARAMGLKVEYEMHALSYLLPRTLFEEHPDWFRMNEEGERTSDFNFCVGNEEALAHLSRSAAELAKLIPAENHLYYFWLDDVTNYRCNCPKCRDLSASDQQLLAVNAMQRGIRTVDPEGCVCYLAYHDAMEPPKRVKSDEGVFLEYAPIHRKLDRFIDDETCPENVAERAPLEDLIAFFGTKNAKVLEYWTDNSLLSNWTKPPKAFALNAEVMRHDVAFYHKLGFESITAFGCYLGQDYVELHGEPELAAYGEILQNG